MFKQFWFLLFFFWPVYVYAHGDILEKDNLTNQEDIAVARRQNIMNVIGANFGTIGCYLKNKCNFKPKLLKRHAESLYFMSKLSMQAFKKQTSNAMVETTAKPIIWEEWSKFKNGLKRMNKKSAELYKAIQSKSDKKVIRRAFKKMAKSCKSCHDDFREK